MKEYIDREKAISKIRMLYKGMPFTKANRRIWEQENKQFLMAEDAIRNLSTEDVRENVYGEWVTVKGSNGKDYRKCTNCLHTQEITGLLNYCPICGADMRGGKDG